MYLHGRGWPVSTVLTKLGQGKQIGQKKNVQQHMRAPKTRGVQGHAPRENVDILGP